MLNGLDPIIIFTFKKAVPAAGSELGKIPISQAIKNFINSPPIPIYLSEKLTGLFIQSESKNIDIETKTETFSSSDGPIVNQKAIGSIIKIDLVASRSSLGLALISALAEIILTKCTSKEYSITYLHGATTIFDGLLHSFAITQDSDTDKYEITIEISKGGAPKIATPQPTADSTQVGLDGGGKITQATLPGTSAAGGTSVPVKQAGSVSVVQP